MATKQRKRKSKRKPQNGIFNMTTLLLLILVIIFMGMIKLNQMQVKTITQISPQGYVPYYFQTGAYLPHQNDTGASISIETINNYPLNGSIGVWVGQILSNGAFIQVGYEINPRTGNYQTNSCQGEGGSYLMAGEPTWFYEFFPNPTGTYNCTSIGKSGTVGDEGGLNTYSFRQIGNTWYFYLNNKTIGNTGKLINASAHDSTLTVMMEYAGTNVTNLYLNTVRFSNLTLYNGNKTTRISIPQSAKYTGYGSGSNETVIDPYEVKIMDNVIYVGSNVNISR